MLGQNIVDIKGLSKVAIPLTRIILKNTNLTGI